MDIEEAILRIKLDRTVCDGFGACALHAPEIFSLDDWGYPSLMRGGEIPPEQEAGVRRAILDCPAHAILDLADMHPERLGGDPGVSRSGRPDAKCPLKERLKQR
ncbi:ferredoxin [Arthrobacter sp. zg-Y1219]|uniref:ferredoxin n=1 Tax=Arthrobacter sp. zg-Y1219 TaxID=3049067 RepID=UPI0024C3BE86|nr:ferredoxin [Arthrobacter sp. zg-Y1219]MDK1361108.1 ferredoxin [Arthrobacter sp. zg-Y1219]